MKKILIALPLVLIMLLTMVPVMADFNGKVYVNYTVYNDPLDKDDFDVYSEPIPVTQKQAENEKELKAVVNKFLSEKYDSASYRIADTDKWFVQTYKPEVKEDIVYYTVQMFINTFKTKSNGVFAFAGVGDIDKLYVKESAAEELFEKVQPGTPDVTITQEDVQDNFNGAYYEKDVTVAEEQQAFVKTYVEAKCSVDPEKPAETKCPVLCDQITVELYDMYNKTTLDKYTKTYDVHKDQVPDQKSIVDHYLNNFFPYNAYQVFYGWDKKPLIRWMDDIEDCTIVIKVLPKYEYIQIVHELFDCCITPDGEVKYDLWRSFVEDDQRWFSRDGVMEIPFLDYHTDLMINQDKAAEYAKTRLEKINAKDFVFQGAKFYDGINLSSYMTGKVTDFAGNVITISNDVPTIVLTYYRGECVEAEKAEEEEKVDDAKVVAGAETTTPAAQQLPATGAKDVTAFFMSAVALLGLGIFFAKKH